MVITLEKKATARNSIIGEAVNAVCKGFEGRVNDGVSMHILALSRNENYVEDFKNEVVRKKENLEKYAVKNKITLAPPALARLGEFYCRFGDAQSGDGLETCFVAVIALSQKENMFKAVESHIQNVYLRRLERY